MNKKLKIVSSLALTGMLVTSSLGINKVLASTTEDNYTTNPVAIYRNLVEGKTVVPFVLVNRDDVLTVKEIVESDLFKGKVEKINGTVISSLDTVVGTGDKFTTTDGTEYTVVVYGDIDGNGKINALDALQVEKSNVNMITLNDVQKEAADVKNDERINSLDSLAIKKYVVGLSESVIDKLPEKEEVIVDSNYTINLKDTSYVNNVNVNSAMLTINLKETLDETKTLKLVISDGESKVEQEIEISAHTDYIEKALASLATLKDGNLTVNLYDEDTIVGVTNIVKNTVEPNATNVNANRISTRKATLSLEKCGTSDITKVKYVVKGISEGTPDITELTNSIDVQNGKLTDAIISENLATNTAYKVFFVIENQYGSQSEIKEAIIASDAANVTAEEALEEVVAPDLSKTETAEFTWDDEAGKQYIATLYKDGLAIEEKTVSDGTVDFTAEMKEEGKYKVSVVVKGADDGSSTNSSATESSEITVSTLKSIENLKFENREDGKVVLSWTNPNSKDDFKEYDIDLYTIDSDGKENKVNDVTCNKLDSNGELVNEVEVTLNSNTIYVAKVKLVANDNQSAMLDTDYIVSEQFYKVAAPNMDTATKGTTSVTFTVQPINIADKNVTYKVEIYDVKTDNDQTEARYTLNSTREVSINKDNQITIDGLTSLNTYAFKLVATVDGNEVESDYSDEIRTLPIINKLTVDTVVEAGKENSGKIAVDGNNLVINGEAFDTTQITELATAKTVISTLKTGDVVTIDDKATNIAIKLDGGASATVAERNLGNLADATVELESNEYNKTITGTFKSLTLKGKDSIFTVNGVNCEEAIVLTDAVEVVGNKEYKLQAGAKVTINDVKVTTEQEVEIAASGKTLTVTANDNANDLVFENSSNGEATIIFDGLDNNTSEQKGTITIKSNGGKVTVKSDKVNVSANMNVEVNNGTVDITAPSLTGDKTVTVSADEGKQSSVIAQTEKTAPDAVKAKGTVVLKEYTDEEIKKEFSVTDQDEIIAISEYIDSFGLNGKDATIEFTTTSDGKDAVIITINGNIADVNISNIK